MHDGSNIISGSSDASINIWSFRTNGFSTLSQRLTNFANKDGCYSGAKSSLIYIKSQEILLTTWQNEEKSNGSILISDMSLRESDQFLGIPIWLNVILWILIFFCVCGCCVGLVSKIFCKHEKVAPIRKFIWHPPWSEWVPD
jgi:hypothetical protein